MRKPKRAKTLAYKTFDKWAAHLSLVSGLLGILGSLLGLLIALVNPPTSSPKTNVSIISALLSFVGGIVVLGIIIVAVSFVLQRKNRDVIVLRRRLSEIYLFALRESALNPQHHVTSND